MSPESRLLALRIALVAVGLTCLAVQPLMIFWPAGWSWHSGHSDYPLMIVGLYMTLGVFLLRAVRDPAAHRSLIWFAVWSSLVHGGIMAVQAVAQPGQMGHLMGDVSALLVAAAALAMLMPRAR